MNKMKKLPTREQYIRKGKRFRKLMMFFLNSRISAQKKPVGDEVFIDTEFGKVRTLWYGFEKTEILIDQLCEINEQNLV